MGDNIQIKEDNIKKQLVKLEAIVKEKNTELKRIHEMNSWRVLLFLVKLKNTAAIFVNNVFRLLAVTVLFILALFISNYLYLLKKIRKSEIFPGG